MPLKHERHIREIIANTAFLGLLGGGIIGTRLAETANESMKDPGSSHMVITDVITNSAGISDIFTLSLVNKENTEISIDDVTRAYNAMKNNFQTDHNLLTDIPITYGKENYTSNWPYSRAFSATIRMYQLNGLIYNYQTDLLNRQDGLEEYWATDVDPYGYNPIVLLVEPETTRRYTDDNGWQGLNLCQLYIITHSKLALTRAKQIFDLNMSQWNDKIGGIYWKVQYKTEQNHEIGTVENGNTAELALFLYAITKDEEYLSQAEKIYDWVNSNLRDKDNLYFNDIANDGSFAPSSKIKWSYNQGVMIGIGVLLYLYAQDNKVTYLQNAEDTARAALNYFSQTQNGFFDQPVEFNDIFFDNLLLLYTVTSDTQLKQSITTALGTYADTIWNNNNIP